MYHRVNCERQKIKNLSSCDSYLWGNLKEKVYANNPRTLEQLKDNIRNEFLTIGAPELLRVHENLLMRAQKCIYVEGGHFEQFL